MSNASGGNNKVAFSLGTNKKKRKVTTVASEFESKENDNEKPKERKQTLIIPMPKTETQQGPLLARKQVTKDDDDDKAARALVDSAADHFALKETTPQGGTDFSAKGKLVIDTNENTNDKETAQFRKDIEARPEDVAFDSDVYQEVRVTDFGAAMLRGMGWTGTSNNSTTSKQDAAFEMPRPHRLGLGATPKIPSLSNKMRRPDQVKRDEQREKQYKEYEAKRQEAIKQDKQVTMQIGSIVSFHDKRAKMIQLQGVPGLNQVLVQFEGQKEATSVKRGDVSLVERGELNDNPFTEIPLNKNRRESEPRNGHDSRSHDKDSDRQYRRDDDRDSSDRISRKHHDRDEDRRSRRKRSRSRERDSSKDKRRRRDRESSKHSTSSNRHNHDPHHWLTPDIRVRVVSKKFGSGMYKQKGVVLDVHPGGAAASIEMDNGQVLTKISEKYLETALPKTGGNAIILVGQHKFAKGKLLERDDRKGVIQLFEDMDVVTMSLDDIAQWCGPLDDDLA